MFICVCIRSPSAPHISLSLSLYLSSFSVSVSGMNSSSGTHGHNQRISSIMEDKTRFSLCFEPNMTRVTLTGMDHILCLLMSVGILTVVRNRINILLKMSSARFQSQFSSFSSSHQTRIKCNHGLQEPLVSCVAVEAIYLNIIYEIFLFCMFDLMQACPYVTCPIKGALVY